MNGKRNLLLLNFFKCMLILKKYVKNQKYTTQAKLNNINLN